MVTNNIDMTTRKQAEASTTIAAEGASESGAPRKPKAAKAKVPTTMSASGTAPATAGTTKVTTILTLLQRKKGASIEEMREATGWQPHSVRGFLSAVVRKKLGLALVSETVKDGIRRYRINDAARAG